MSGFAVRALGVLVTIAGLAAIGAASQWSLSTNGEGSIVRLSWRTAPIRLESCRQLTDEEMAAIPAHMRRTEECTGGYADYELSLRITGIDEVTDTIAPAGLRGDRPVYVFVDRPVPPGIHEVEVSFRALVPADFDADAAAPLTWSGALQLAPGEIGLISLSADGRRLVRVER